MGIRAPFRNGTRMASQQWIVRLKMREVNLDGSDQGLGQMQVEFYKRSLVKSANIVSWSGCYERERTAFSSEQMQWTNLGWHFELDDRQARSVLFKCCNSQANATLTPGSNGAATAAAAGGTDQTILSSCEHHDHRSMTGLCEYMSDMRDDNTPRHQRGYARSLESDGGMCGTRQEDCMRTCWKSAK